MQCVAQVYQEDYHTQKQPCSGPQPDTSHGSTSPFLWEPQVHARTKSMTSPIKKPLPSCLLMSIEFFPINPIPQRSPKSRSCTAPVSTYLDIGEQLKNTSYKTACPNNLDCIWSTSLYCTSNPCDKYAYRVPCESIHQTIGLRLKPYQCKTNQVAGYQGHTRLLETCSNPAPNRVVTIKYRGMRS